MSSSECAQGSDFHRCLSRDIGHHQADYHLYSCLDLANFSEQVSTREDAVERLICGTYVVPVSIIDLCFTGIWISVLKIGEAFDLLGIEAVDI